MTSRQTRSATTLSEVPANSKHSALQHDWHVDDRGVGYGTQVATQGDSAPRLAVNAVKFHIKFSAGNHRLPAHLAGCTMGKRDSLQGKDFRYGN